MTRELWKPNNEVELAILVGLWVLIFLTAVMEELAK